MAVTVQQFKHPKTKKILQFKWDDAWGAPDEAFFDDLVAKDDAWGASEEAKKKLGLEFDPASGDFSFKDFARGTGERIKGKAGEKGLSGEDIQSAQDSWARVYDEFNPPQDKMTPPPQLRGALPEKEPEINIPLITPALSWMRDKITGIGEPDSLSAPPTMAETARRNLGEAASGVAGLGEQASKAASTGGEVTSETLRMAVEPIAEAAMGGTLDPRYQRKFMETKDGMGPGNAMQQAVQGWTKGLMPAALSGGEFLTADTRTQVGMMGTTKEEMDRWYRLNPTLGKGEMFGEAGLELGLGLALGMPGTMAKARTGYRAATLLVDPFNFAQAEASVQAAKRMEMAQRLGKEASEKLLQKEALDMGEAVKAIQAIETATKQGQIFTDVENVIGKAFLPGMAYGAVQGFKDSTDPNLSERERALGLFNAMTSGGMGVMALYHATAKNAGVSPASLMDDPVARMAVEKYLGGDKEALATFRDGLEKQRAAQAAADAQLEAFNEQLQMEQAQTLLPPPGSMAEALAPGKVQRGGTVGPELQGPTPPLSWYEERAKARPVESQVPPDAAEGIPPDAVQLPGTGPVDEMTPPPPVVDEAAAAKAARREELKRKLREAQEKEVAEAAPPPENEPLASVRGLSMSHGIEAPESIASIEELSLARKRSAEKAGADLPAEERIRKMAEADTAEDEARFAEAEKLTQEFERGERDTIQEIPVSVHGAEAPNEAATELIHGVMADPTVAKVQRVVQRLEPTLSRSVFGVTPKKTGRLGIADAFGWAKLDKRTIQLNPLYMANHILNFRGLKGDEAVDAFKSVMADIIVHESTHAKTQLGHKATDALTFGGEFGKRNKQEQLKARQLKKQLDSLLSGTKDDITVEDVKALADLWNKELAPGGDFDAEPVSLKKLADGKLGGPDEVDASGKPTPTVPFNSWKDRVLEDYKKAVALKDYQKAVDIARGLPPQGPDSLPGIIEAAWQRGHRKSGKDHLPSMDELSRMKQPDEWKINRKLSAERKAEARKVLQESGKAEALKALEDPEVREGKLTELRGVEAEKKAATIRALEAEIREGGPGPMIALPGMDLENSQVILKARWENRKRALEAKLRKLKGEEMEKPPASAETMTPPPTMEGEKPREDVLLESLNDSIQEIKAADLADHVQLRLELFGEIKRMVKEGQLTKEEGEWMKIHANNQLKGVGEAARKVRFGKPNEPLAAPRLEGEMSPPPHRPYEMRSRIEEALEGRVGKLPEKATVEHYVKELRKLPGVNEEQLGRAGLLTALEEEPKRSLTREQLLAEVRKEDPGFEFVTKEKSPEIKTRVVQNILDNFVNRPTPPAMTDRSLHINRMRNLISRLLNDVDVDRTPAEAAWEIAPTVRGKAEEEFLAYLQRSNKLTRKDLVELNKVLEAKQARIFKLNSAEANRWPSERETARYEKRTKLADMIKPPPYGPGAEGGPNLTLKGPSEGYEVEVGYDKRRKKLQDEGLHGATQYDVDSHGVLDGSRRTEEAFWVRRDIRTDSEGKKGMFINEIQSDKEKNLQRSKETIEDNTLRITRLEKELDRLNKDIANQEKRLASAEFEEEVQARVDGDMARGLVEDREHYTTTVRANLTSPLEYNKIAAADIKAELNSLKHNQPNRGYGEDILPASKQEHKVNMMAASLANREWLRAGVKRTIQSAVKKGLDRVYFPTTGEQIAQIEGWGSSLKRQAGKWYVGGKDVTDIVERLTKDAHNIARDFAKRYGAEVKEVGLDIAAVSGEESKVLALELSPALKEQAKKGFTTWKSETGAVDLEALTSMSGAAVGGLLGFQYAGPMGALVGASAGAVGGHAMIAALKGVKAGKKSPILMAKHGKEIEAWEKSGEGDKKMLLRDLQAFWLSAVVGAKETVWRNVVQTVATGGLLGAVDFAYGASYKLGIRNDATFDAYYRTLHRMASIKDMTYFHLLFDTARMTMDGVFKGEGKTRLKEFKTLERLGRKFVDPDLQRQFELVMSGEVEIGGGKTRKLRPLERAARMMMIANAAQERAFRYTIMERELAPLLAREGLTSDRAGYAKLYKKAKTDFALQSRITAAMSKAETRALWRTKALHSSPDGVAATITRLFDQVPLFSRLIVQFPNYLLNNFLINMVETNPIFQGAFDAFEVVGEKAGVDVNIGPRRSSRRMHQKYDQFMKFTQREASSYEKKKANHDAFYNANKTAIEAALKVPSQNRSTAQKQLLSDWGDLKWKMDDAKKAWEGEQTNLRKHFQGGYYGKDFATRLKLLGSTMVAFGYLQRLLRGDDDDSAMELKGKDGKMLNVSPILGEFAPMWLIGDWLARRKLGSKYYENKPMVHHVAQIFSGGRPIQSEGVTDLLRYYGPYKDDEGERSLRKIAANLGQQVGKMGALGDVFKAPGEVLELAGKKEPMKKTRPDLSPEEKEETVKGIPQSFWRGFMGNYTDKGLVPSYDPTSGEVRRKQNVKEMLLNFGLSVRDRNEVGAFLEAHPKVKPVFLRPVTGKAEWDEKTFAKMREALTKPLVRMDSGEKITLPEVLRSDKFSDEDKEKLLTTHLSQAMSGEETRQLREAVREKDVSGVPKGTLERYSTYEEDRKRKRDLRGELRHRPREPRPLKRPERKFLDDLIPMERQPKATQDKMTPPPTGGGSAEGGGGGGGAPSPQLLADAAKRHKVDEKLIRAVVKVESAGKKFAVSSKGARGWMQIMPSTFKAFGGQDPTNGWENIMVGTKYLKHLLEMFDGDVEKALAAYNAGPTRVKRGGELPAETRRYVQKVMASYSAMR